MNGGKPVCLVRSHTDTIPTCKLHKGLGIKPAASERTVLKHCTTLPPLGVINDTNQGSTSFKVTLLLLHMRGCHIHPIGCVNYTTSHNLKAPKQKNPHVKTMQKNVSSSFKSAAMRHTLHKYKDHLFYLQFLRLQKQSAQNSN